MEFILPVCNQFQKIVLSLLFVKMKNSDHEIMDNLSKRETFCCKDRIMAFVIQPYSHKCGF